MKIQTCRLETTLALKGLKKNILLLNSWIKISSEQNVTSSSWADTTPLRPSVWLVSTNCHFLVAIVTVDSALKNEEKEGEMKKGIFNYKTYGNDVGSKDVI